jgi:Rod binding domain-containing protein
MAIPADLAMSLPSLDGTQPSATAGGMKQIRQAAQEFESVFLTTMLQQMFAGVETDGPFGGGHGEEMFRSLLIEEYGSSIAAAGGIGVADEVARELLSIQEASQ